MLGSQPIFYFPFFLSLVAFGHLRRSRKLCTRDCVLKNGEVSQICFLHYGLFLSFIVLMTLRRDMKKEVKRNGREK